MSPVKASCLCVLIVKMIYIWIDLTCQGQKVAQRYMEDIKISVSVLK